MAALRWSIRRGRITTTGHARAATRSFIASQMAQFADEIVIPVPPAAVQRGVIEATEAVAAAAQAVAAAGSELWLDPSDASRILSKLRLPYGERDLADWTTRLPYPLAGALWVYETEKHDSRRAQDHLLRFWEATAEFIGTILMSALDGDPTLRRSEFAKLQRALSKVGHSLDRATFGVWATIVQRLSASFRAGLESGDPDLEEKVLRLFGYPPAHTLSRLLAPEIGALLSRANALRNDWLGHGGAATRLQAEARVQILLELTDQLRDVTTAVWEDYRMIRAGRMARRDGKYHVEAELARGATAPFRRKEIVFAEPLDEGALYLTTLGTEGALRLSDLIVLRPAPANASYTCYFYNRREATGFRFIAYQYAEEASVLDDRPDLARLFTDFAEAYDEY